MFLPSWSQNSFKRSNSVGQFSCYISFQIIIGLGIICDWWILVEKFDLWWTISFSIFWFDFSPIFADSAGAQHLLNRTLHRQRYLKAFLVVYSLSTYNQRSPRRVVFAFVCESLIRNGWIPVGYFVWDFCFQNALYLV